MILGGIIILNDNISIVEKKMQKCREETEMFGELKWSKVSNHKFDEYKKFIDFSLK